MEASAYRLPVVFDYEVSMFEQTLNFGTHVALPLPQYILNAITESLLLHTRILVDILISERSDSDDITLRKLLPAFTSPDVASLKSLYGDGKTLDTPRWTLNKRLAHASQVRSESHDYRSLINCLAPTILNLVEQVKRAKAASA
jgi:hypothetical protein